MKRRKRGGQPKGQQASNAPEPLQPKYFENEVGEKAPELAPHAAESSQAQSVEPDDGSGERETQADFQLSTRRPPELPLAEAVRGEARVPSSRRRKRRGGRGGRGERAERGDRRGPATRGSGASTAPPASAMPAEGVSAPEGDAYEVPLTPESSSGAPVEAIAPVAVPDAPVAPVAAAAAAAGPVPTAVAPRPSKGTVVLAIGLPGSGKSSWFKRHNIRPLSSDLLRELLFDDEQEQRFQDLVFSNLRSMLKARLIARRPMSYVDATNLTPHDRHSWIKLAKDYGYDVQGLFFDVPLEVCLERHARRGRVVPEDIMRKMAGKLKPPTFEEGFSKITVVRVKQKDAAAS